MIHKKIDITQALLSNVEEDVATEFIDHRELIKKPLTQGAFNRAVNAALKCQFSGLCTVNEAFEITIDNGWQGVTPEYIANKIASHRQAAVQARTTMAITSNTQPRLVSDNTKTKDVPIDLMLNDHSWANGGE